MQKTFGLSNDEVMWGDSWINLSMKMRDMPYYRYISEDEEVLMEGTVDILESKFAKFKK